MFYYLYEIKNLINGKIYVGVHKTKNLDDGYMGSGKVIKRAIDKHGFDNFAKTILEQFDDSTAMFAREKEIVTEEFLMRKDVYNLRRGGFGGFDYINANYQQYDRRSGNSRGGKKGGKIAGKMTGAKNINAARAAGRLPGPPSFKGKKHSDSTKQKMSCSKKVTSAGEKNSQFGTMWVTNGISNQKIQCNDIIESGWRKGRVMQPNLKEVMPC